LVDVNDNNYTVDANLGEAIGFTLDVGSAFPHNDLFGTPGKTVQQSVTQLTILPASTKEEAINACEAQGLSLASFSTHDFETEQGVVADAVVASVGYDQPVMTNVVSDLGHCMSVSAQDNGHNLWAETECTQTVMPAMCREGGPGSQGQAFVATRSYGTTPVTADASALPAFVLLACVMVLFNFVTKKYQMRRRAEVAMEELELAPLTGLSDAYAFAGKPRGKCSFIRGSSIV